MRTSSGWNVAKRVAPLPAPADVAKPPADARKLGNLWIKQLRVGGGNHRPTASSTVAQTIPPATTAATIPKLGIAAEHAHSNATAPNAYRKRGVAQMGNQKRTILRFTRNGRRLQNIRYHGNCVDTLDLGVGCHDQAVRQYESRDILHVVRRNELAPVDRGGCL